jgi:hypothetical protein
MTDSRFQMANQKYYILIAGESHFLKICYLF